MYLFFDTETTGLPTSWKAPLTRLSNWPRMVQLAWLQYNEAEEKISGRNYIIRPEGFTIPKEVEQIHGISTERAIQEGVALKKVLQEFAVVLEESKFLVAHNMSFDEKIIGAEFLRKKVPINPSGVKKICTMKTSAKFCQISSSNGYKWPNLSELRLKLFNKDFDEAHNAAADVECCADCFFELKKLGVIE